MGFDENLLETIKKQDEPSKSSSNKKYAEEAIFKDEKRSESQKNNIHKISICSIWVLWGIVITLFIIRSVHYIIPDCWEWLEKSKLQSLDRFLFSGVVGALLGKFGDRVLGQKKS